MKVKFLDRSERDVEIAPGADLRWADLSGAYLREADLSGAHLSEADLRWADLRWADLRGAYLRGAGLSGADLSGAHLSEADLSGADLRWADLRGADLRGTNLSNAKGLERFCILPAGDLVGYKKLKNGSIATLRIPSDAKRVNSYSSRKCRAEFVYVIDGEGVDNYTGKTVYRRGTLVRADSFDPDPRVECSHGIHFFITRKEAEEFETSLRRAAQ